MTARMIVYKDDRVPVPSISSLPPSTCSVYEHVDSVSECTCV